MESKGEYSFKVLPKNDCDCEKNIDIYEHLCKKRLFLSFELQCEIDLSLLSD